METTHDPKLTISYNERVSSAARRPTMTCTHSSLPASAVENHVLETDTVAPQLVAAAVTEETDNIDPDYPFESNETYRDICIDT